jgi:predicted Zn-dependent protease with MMP-like domain
MKREHFVKSVEVALDSLPQEFRSRIKNVAILVEDFPPNQVKYVLLRRADAVGLSRPLSAGKWTATSPMNEL